MILRPTPLLIAAALTLSAPAALAATKPGDPVHGKEIYAQCGGCHSLTYDRIGPRHCGLFGRKAGSVPGYAYTDAMKHYGVVWNAKTLDHFLTDPMKVVPGTAMGFAGIPDAQDRADLIAYLKQADASPVCKK